MEKTLENIHMYSFHSIGNSKSIKKKNRNVSLYISHFLNPIFFVQWHQELSLTFIFLLLARYVLLKYFESMFYF